MQRGRFAAHAHAREALNFKLSSRCAAAGSADGSGLPLNDNLALSPGPFAPLRLCHFDSIDLFSYLNKLWIFYAGLGTPRLAVLLSVVHDSPSSWPLDVDSHWITLGIGARGTCSEDLGLCAYIWTEKSAINSASVL